METKIKLGILTSHPIQYQVPLFKELNKLYNLKVFFMQKVTAKQQSDAGFGVEFNWDIDFLHGYKFEYLENVSTNPGVNNFLGCNTPSIYKKLGEEKPDVLIITGWYLYSYVQAIIACRKLNIPILVRGDSQLTTKRSGIKRFLKFLSYHILMRQFAGFLIVGFKAKEYFKYYGAEENKMFNVPHFVDNVFFKRNSVLTFDEVNKLKIASGIDKDNKVLLFVGKFIPKKRPLDILYAAKILLEKDIKCTCLFVGSGELENEIQIVASKININIVLAGFKNQTELPRYYTIADILILPSDSGETWGLVVNEALACGLRAVVSDEAGCGPDLIIEGITGTIFRTGNILELASGIEKILNIPLTPEIKEKINRKISEYSISKAVIGINQAIDYVTNS